MASDQQTAEEIAELIREVKERVRARFPEGSVPISSEVEDGNSRFRLPLPDLLPVVHARDAAQAKVAAIGGVNPRRGGLVNAAIQKIKHLISRSLNWFVRDQVTFNREVLRCVDALTEAMNENNRALSSLAEYLRQQDAEQRDLAAAEAQQAQDMLRFWTEWRQQWERNLEGGEIRLLRSLAESQNAYSHRLIAAESSFREALRAQHGEFRGETQTLVERVRGEFEAAIHSELRVLRQRMMAEGALARAHSAAEPATDMQAFAGRFRGPESTVRQNAAFYLPFFAGRKAVLDIGCGRGEFLEILKSAEIPARGIDLDAECVAYCRSMGLDVEVADLFPYLANLPDGSLDGIFSAQVVEHIPPAQLPEMIRLCGQKLKAGGVLVLETPNPECLAIFASHFYLDPTHQRPVPAQLLTFYMQEAGLGHIEIHYLAPALESFPELSEIPEGFRQRFFGGLDYGIIGRKL